MCGIAGIHVLDAKASAKLDLTRLASNLLREIDHRGGDATGALSFGPRGVTVQKASCKVSEFLSEWQGVPDGAWTTLLHTRYATQGSAAFPENNHPVSSGRVHLVHNGVITNDDKLFSQLGASRTGRVDSEVIPAVIASAGWNDAGSGLSRLDGSYAIAAVYEKAPGELLLARAGWSPLHWVTNGKILVWASETDAIIEAWRYTFGGPAIEPARVARMEEGEFLHVRGSDLERGTFAFQVQAPKVVTYTYTYKGSKKEYPVPSAQVLQLNKPTEKTCDVGPNLPWKEDIWTPEGFEIRCACCDEWIDEDDSQQVFGELVCHSCATFLREEDVTPMTRR